jgi:hypothetical protein
VPLQRVPGGLAAGLAFCTGVELRACDALTLLADLGVEQSTLTGWKPR